MFDRIRAYPMVVLLLPLVAAILLINQLHPLFPSSDAEPQKYGFVIESAPKPTAQCERFETRVLTGGKGIATHVYLYLLRDSTRALPTYGDTVVAHTKIEWQRTTGRAFAAKYLVLPAQTHQEPLQVRLYHRLTEAGLEGDELATVGALTLGHKDDIDPEVKRHFQASGAAHVLAVSGLHTGIIYTLLIGLLTLGGRIRPRHENRFGRRTISLIIIAAMWGYAWLTGMTPSVVRAVLMVTHDPCAKEFADKGVQPDMSLPLNRLSQRDGRSRSARADGGVTSRRDSPSHAKVCRYAEYPGTASPWASLRVKDRRTPKSVGVPGRWKRPGRRSKPFENVSGNVLTSRRSFV